MNIKVKKLLNLSDSELRILEKIRSMVSITPSGLAISTGIPRTTISFLLEKLAKRGLVERVSVKNHKEWGACSKNISDLESYFATDNFSVIKQVNGIRGIEKLCLEMFELGAAERVYYIQGSESSAYALAKLDEVFWKRFHKEIKKKKIILEGVAAESVLVTFNGLSKSQLLSHKDRMVIAYLVPDQMLRMPIDFFIFKNKILIIDYMEEVGVSVRQKNIVAAFQLFVEMAKNFGRKMNLNEYIFNLLEKK